MIPSYVYIDGFNLYYGAVKGTPYKWLNPLELVCKLLPKNRIDKIKYFTARVAARSDDPDKPTRQQTYFRALQTLPNLEIIEGHFLTHSVRMALANPIPGLPRVVEVIKTEEKGSDVNIATHLLLDAFRNAYQVAILISNDSDLVEPVKAVKYECGRTVIVLNPRKDHQSVALKQHADFVKPIRAGVLKASQFPHTLTDRNGTFTRPAGW